VSKAKVLRVGAGLVLALASPATAVEPCGAGAAADSRIESLQAVYYCGGALPPEPTLKELAELQTLKALPELQDEADFLEKAFPGDERLQAFAIRDRDGDGVKDYRISPEGSFRENDTDVDCDGLANALDSDPYGLSLSPGAPACALEPDWRQHSADGNGNGVPDHIDWSLSDAAAGGELRPADIQAGLYRDYGILLLDRQQRMPAALAVELDYVVREVFRNQVAPDLAPLRAIATGQPMCPGSDDYGWASPQNATLYLMPLTFELSPILRLEILVHEITHTLQFARDYSAEDLRGFRTRNRYDSDGFHSFASSLGWEAAQDQVPPFPAYRLAVKSCEFDYPFTLTYLGQPIQHWATVWDSEDAEARRQGHMVSRYAFIDAWEWQAEYNAAFVLNRLVEAASSLCTAEQLALLAERLRDDLATEWSYLAENARGLAAYETVVAGQFQAGDDAWIAMARHFLLGSYPGLCDG